MKPLKRILALILCVMLLVPMGVSAAEYNYPSFPTDAAASPSDAIEEPSDYDEPEEPEEPDYPVEPEQHFPEIVLSDTRFSLTVGSTFSVKAETVDFETEPDRIIWSSENSSVASVDSRGVVTAVGTGETKIKALAYDGETAVSAYCTVTVN